MKSDVLGELCRALAAGERVALATLVDARGSTPQKAGARLLVHADGSTFGTLGGGCIEAEVCEAAIEAIAGGAPRVLDFELNEDIAVDYGLACGGTEVILIDPTFGPRDLPLAQEMREAANGGRRGIVLSLLDAADGVAPASKLAVWDDGRAGGDFGPMHAEALHLANSIVHAPRPAPALLVLANGARAFADVFAESPEIVIVGGGHVGYALAAVAKVSGYRFSVIDDREQFASRERFPDADTVIAADIEAAVAAYPATRNSAIVIVTRGHKYDYQALAAAARTPAGYVGLMGSRRKVALIYRQLLADGVPEERLRDIHAPIGLDIGAVTPEEIALSIVAEITMDRLGGAGAPLRERSDVVAAACRRPGA